ncbi:mitotic spindle assembly checkpoint protein MAD1-like [Anopheles albimanus]|uniref:Mitotic checkpoint protein mad1 n=1 Tax=Anopheles albimanus TaxID=7167 RepID=A0A182FE99_ANOAL|nr:mitotic spindle assembly checkpoint protein MAD1-like [Anopheles albimanus]
MMDNGRDEESADVTRLSNSSFEISRKKRRISGLGLSGANDTLNDVNTSSESLASSVNTTQLVAQSPWETRRMKADLIEARSRITVLKKEIEHQNTVMATNQLRNQHKISSLEQELAHSSKKAADLEKHLSAVRKREHAAKEELVRTRNQFNQLKQTSDDQQFELQSALQKLEQKYNCDTSELGSEIRELTAQVSDLMLQLSGVQEELDVTRGINDTLQSKADAYDQTKRELEQKIAKLEETESRVKKLEFECGSHEDWKNLSKVTTSRLLKCTEYEHENIRMREELKNLRDLIGNKLLLEEQVSNLQARVDRYEQQEATAATIEVRVKELESELNDWKQLGRDYCPKKDGAQRSEPSAALLRHHIAQLLQKDVILTSEQSTAVSEQHQTREAFDRLRMEKDSLEKQSEEYKRSLKHYQSVLQRVQRKLKLVISERDCMKQVVENYENDLTINQSIAQAGQDSHQLQERIKSLEKVLANYQEHCQKLEAEIHSKQAVSDTEVSNALTSEQYQELRKEIDSLRMENQTIRRRKQELELEIEQNRVRSLAPILRHTDSLAVKAFDQHQNSVEKLQAEIERLRAKIRSMQENCGEQQLEASVTNSNMTMNVMELNNMRAKAEMLESKMKQMKEKFREASVEFRDICYLLFGYRVDRVSNNNYRVRSMYADNDEDYLNFQLDESSGKLNMLASRYGQSLLEQVDGLLNMHGSLPVFLSTLTLDLFKRTTIMDVTSDGS